MKVRYTIAANGDEFPDIRVEFCAGVSSAPDDSSFQITIYGGYSLYQGYPYNDVWVLSVPTFTWIKVTPSDKSLGDGSYGRHLQTCHMGNEAQMIVLGGSVQTMHNPSTIVTSTGCSDSHAPLLVLNTNTFQWSDAYNPDLTYTQPVVVYEAIGGG